jgi:hypothetical protein
MQIEVSHGEIVDKFTIVKIKYEKAILNTEMYWQIKKEYDYLSQIVNTINVDTRIIDLLYNTNLILWDIEDEIRLCEKNRCFDQKFIELARAVYKTNDERAKIKKQINIISNSDLVEEKSYKNYVRDEN